MTISLKIAGIYSRPWRPHIPRRFRRHNANLTPQLWAKRAQQINVPYNEPNGQHGPKIVRKAAA